MPHDDELKNTNSLSAHHALTFALKEAIADFLFNESEVEMYLLDRDGRYIWVNEVAANKLGWSAPEMTGKSLFDIDPAIPLEDYHSLFDQTISGMRPKFDLRYQVPKGDTIYSQLTCLSLNSQGKDLLCAVGRDVTEDISLKQQMKESETKYRAVFENSASAVMIIDNDRIVSLVNKEFERLTGYTAGEFQGKKSWESLIPSDADKALMLNYHERRRIDSAGVPTEYEVEIMTKEGVRKTVRVQANLIPGTDQSVASLMDITGDKKTLGQLTRTSRALKVLSACNRAVVHAGREQELFDTICKILVEEGQYKKAWVGKAEPDGEIQVITEQGHKNDYLIQVRITWAEEDNVGQGPAGKAIRTGKPATFNHAQDHPDLAPWQEDLIKRGYEAIVGLPLPINGSIWGVLLIYAAEPDAFDTNEMDLLQELASDLAFGVSFLRATADREFFSQELEESLKGTVEVIQSIVDRRDPYTAGHQKQVTDLAVAIGRELQMDQKALEGLYMGGMVHDLGKISVPIEVLTKPGRISDTEFSLIKAHAQEGYDLLKDVNFPWPVADIAYQHHERIDGSGYPQGLKGVDILIEAKIMSVADVVEAMASHQPYRPGLGVDVALKEIQDKAGKLFDPEVVKACVRLFKDKGYELVE